MVLRAREVVILIGLCGLASLPGACGSVKTPTPGDPCGGACGPDQVCVDGICSDPCEGVECADGEQCIGGECVPVFVDEDGDTYDAQSDCDDHNPDVVPGSTQDCSTKCGNGVQVCRDGAWQPCTAPKNCECDVPAEEPCGLCGTAIRDCIDHVYAPETGPCDGQGDCEPLSIGVLACAQCGTQGETCGEDCHWGAPEGECTGSEIVDPVACPDAGNSFCNSNGLCVPA
jgi:hypothetical protein